MAIVYGDGDYKNMKMSEEESLNHYYFLNHALAMGGVDIDKLYEYFKYRLMKECSLVNRMTEEEYADWKEKAGLKAFSKP